MKLPIIPLSLFTVFIIGAGVTNPDQKKFEQFIMEKGSTTIKQEICQTESENILEKFVSNACTLLTNSSMELVSRFVTENTTRQNFLLFSIYEVNPEITEFKALGMFNNFIVLKEGK
ncbi:DUF4359 domain-containing protein [Geminocystis herdmanii]|uniref:DUF4359 domain-containing protein n=1 Tax=Geminocystis herdmanii TaxID=669359 RepID=UPI0003489E00|nr:DUF4359 domain-containing protein [Geminocystis herdmanii]